MGFGLPWYVCLLAAIAAGAVLGAISGLLKAYRNVNEVISCIMLNWISLYLVNALLSQVKETASPYTFTLSSTNPAAFLGGLNPIGAIFSSYFIQHITNGGAYVDKTMYSAQISDLISALIIYLCGFVLFFKVFMNSRLDRRDEKRRAKEDRPGSEEGGKA